MEFTLNSNTSLYVRFQQKYPLLSRYPPLQFLDVFNGCIFKALLNISSISVNSLLHNTTCHWSVDLVFISVDVPVAIICNSVVVSDLLVIA